MCSEIEVTSETEVTSEIEVTPSIVVKLSDMEILCERVVMQQYKLKRGFKPDIERIYTVMQECFPTEISRNGKSLETAYGAMSSIKVWIENKMLYVETVSDKTVTNDDIVMQTNKAFRDFLLKATGFTAKERVKNAKKEVGEE